MDIPIPPTPSSTPSATSSSPASVQPITQPAQPAHPPMFCPFCHQPVTPQDYFCPNCGKKLSEPPLSTSVGTQAWIYLFSAVLPIICYLAVSYWPGIKYARSSDPKTKQIGFIAIAIITISTIITFWLAAIWINQAIQSATSVATGGLLGGSGAGL